MRQKFLLTQIGVLGDAKVSAFMVRSQTIEILNLAK